MKWLGRMVVNTLVRRLTVLALMGVLAWCGLGKAQAQDYSQCESLTVTGTLCPTLPTAKAAAEANVRNLNPGANRCVWFGTPSSYDATTWQVYAYISYAGNPCAGPGSTGSAAGASRRYPKTLSSCAVRPDLHNQAVVGPSGLACSDGCVFASVLGGGLQAGTLGSGANKRWWAGTWGATGSTCSTEPTSVPNDPTKQNCVQTGAYGECVKPNGDHCWSKTADSKKICWKPGETGKRATIDGTLGGDRVVAPATPTAPPELTSPTAGPTSTTTVNNTSYNSGVYTGTGANPGQGNTGVDGDADGDGKADEGDGEGEGGTPGPVVGDLYEGSGDTIGGVYSAFKTQAINSPLIHMADGVFSGCTGGGSCPNETWDGGEYAGVHSLENLCNGALGPILGWAGWVCLAGMAAVAFKIGIL